MNPDQAVALAASLFNTTLFVAGPLLAVCMVAGVIVGIVQTATQVNEPSISFLVKVAAVVVVCIAFGSQLATHVLDYMRDTYAAIGNVVR